MATDDDGQSDAGIAEGAPAIIDPEIEQLTDEMGENVWEEELASQRDVSNVHTNKPCSASASSLRLSRLKFTAAHVF